MKKFLTLVIVLLPLFSFAKFYKAKLVYKNGNTENIEVKLPIIVTAKKVVIKRNGKSEKIKADLLSYLDVTLNNGKDHYYFKRGVYTQFKNNGEHKSLKKETWSLVEEVFENMIISAAGFKYSVKKYRGEEKLIVTYNEFSQGYYLSKPKENLLVSIEPNMGVTLKKMVERAQGYLFPECPNFSEKIERGKIKRGEHIEQIVAMYQECSK